MIKLHKSGVPVLAEIIPIELEQGNACVREIIKIYISHLIYIPKANEDKVFAGFRCIKILL